MHEEPFPGYYFGLAAFLASFFGLLGYYIYRLATGLPGQYSRRDFAAFVEKHPDVWGARLALIFLPSAAALGGFIWWCLLVADGAAKE